MHCEMEPTESQIQESIAARQVLCYMLVAASSIIIRRYSSVEERMLNSLYQYWFQLARIRSWDRNPVMVRLFAS
jgi:hypothetical protein